MAVNWPADKIERKPVSDLVPYARNARTHTDHQIDQIAASIREWGWTMPVLVAEDGTIIAGHARVQAAQKLGVDEIPCVVAEGWTEAQRKAYVIADNQLTLNGGWDSELLGTELAELGDMGFDLSLTGLDMDAIEQLTAEKTDGLTDEDETPEAEEKAVTRTGDTWLLGRHRVRCGDSTSADDVTALLNGVEPHLMVTDPPYGVEYDPGWRNGDGNGKGGVGSGTRAVGAVHNDERCDWLDAYSLFPGEVAYVWHGAMNAPTVASNLADCGFQLRAQVIWAKQKLVPGRGHYHWQHEPCWYAVKGTGHWQGSRKESTLWQIDKPVKSETGHSTQKPVECMRRPIVNNSAPGQPVYDPFLGSGTTLIAGEKEGRPVYGIELDPSYCDVIVKRWQDFTGQQAVLEGDGRTFDEIRAEREA